MNEVIALSLIKKEDLDDGKNLDTSLNPLYGKHTDALRRVGILRRMLELDVLQKNLDHSHELPPSFKAHGDLTDEILFFNSLSSNQKNQTANSLLVQAISSLEKKIWDKQALLWSVKPAPVLQAEKNGRIILAWDKKIVARRFASSSPNVWL